MIRIEGYTQYFHRGGVNEIRALEQVDLHLAKGDFVTLIGSNGAGKSTLLNGLAGVHRADEGQMWIGGRNVTDWPEHRRAAYIGRVFQDPLVGTCASLSIEQNMALSFKRGQGRGLSLGVKQQDRGFFREQLQILGLGLEDRLKASVGLLSGGQRQALTMVMATLIEPEVLLLDEHTAALDPKTARQILELTGQIVAIKQLTTMMVTHNMAQALAYGNRLVMLHQGGIILDVSGEEKKNLTVEDLLAQFYTAQGEAFASDRALLC
ncbi:MAG: ATP-binding cassette domain-containing protein [Desulfobacteraceae bacterium]|nr:ATP-binding cassette domain-containing protein [Desulfobacteraceae bacterium]MBC2750703.1 ATP-binding cassette domain-containing protein [Desulfobacteraceae bacterium]